jgi:hypothetical protein
MLGMGTNMYPSLALLKQCKDELIASTGGARVNSRGEGANRTIYLINMLINHLNMLVTVHPLENMQTGGGAVWPLRGSALIASIAVDDGFVFPGDNFQLQLKYFAKFCIACSSLKFPRSCLVEQSTSTRSIGNCRRGSTSEA